MPLIVLVWGLCRATIVEVLALEFQTLKLLHDNSVWFVKLGGAAVVRALRLLHVLNTTMTEEDRTFAVRTFHWLQDHSSADTAFVVLWDLRKVRFNHEECLI